MKVDVIREPAERDNNDVKNQVDIDILADSEAIVSVNRAVDGNYLFLTDKKGAKLRVTLDQNCAMFLENHRGMMLANTRLYAYARCRDCDCIYRVFAGQRMCYDPSNGRICNC